MVFGWFKKKKEEIVEEKSEKVEEQKENKEPAQEASEKKEEPKKELLNYKKPLDEIENKLEDKRIIDVMKKIRDPELDIDIWSLELIYDIDVKEKNIDIKMTFTSPMCPFGPQIVNSVKTELKGIGFEEPNVEVVFSPPWEPSEQVKEILGVA